MFNRIFADRREKKRKEEHERELKERLAKKFARYEQEQSLKEEIAAAASDDTEIIDYTEITLNGQKLRVAKESITIQDVDPGKVATDSQSKDSKKK